MVRDGDWVTFLRCLLIDGLFPVMTWIPFFLAGMAVGRLLVATARVHRTARAAGGLVVLGVVLSAATLLVSRFIVGPLGFRDHHAATAPGVRRRRTRCCPARSGPCRSTAGAG